MLVDGIEQCGLVDGLRDEGAIEGIAMDRRQFGHSGGGGPMRKN
jgi:hypothetical protein